MSNPRVPTLTFPVSSPKLRACCAREVHFLYADLRPRDSIAEWEAALAGAPMRMLSHEDINAQVLRGMEINTQRILDLIEPRAEIPAPHLPRIRRVCKARRSTAQCNAGSTRTGCTASSKIDGGPVDHERRVECPVRVYRSRRRSSQPVWARSDVPLLRSDLEHALLTLLARRDEPTHCREKSSVREHIPEPTSAHEVLPDIADYIPPNNFGVGTHYRSAANPEDSAIAGLALDVEQDRDPRGRP